MTQIYELIQSIQGTQTIGKNEPSQPESTSVGATKSFGDTLTDFLDAVNDNSKEAAQQVTNVIEGKSDNLAQAMMSMEESKLSFQLMLEIRTKLLESYQEISRMQV